MDALLGTIETLSCIGEVLGRSQEKNEELAALNMTVKSISQALVAFTGRLTPEERLQLYASNEVFPSLLRHLEACHQVLAKRHQVLAKRHQLALEQGPETAGEGRGVSSAVWRGLGRGGTVLQEGLEVLSSKVGRLGSDILRLPEDELAVIRSSDSMLQKLLPLLTLAVSTSPLFLGGGGQKRSCPFDDVEWQRRTGRPAGLLAVANGATNTFGVSAEATSEERVKIQLVSDNPVPEAQGLPAIEMSELRTGAAGASEKEDSEKMTIFRTQSDLSRDLSGPAFGRVAPGVGGDGRRRVLGRQELKGKLPSALKLPAENGPATMVPYMRFVSRDHLLLEILPPPLHEPSASAEMDTLRFGLFDGSHGVEMDTLAWGGGSPRKGGSPPAASAAKPPPVATAMGLSSAGFHVRPSGGSKWLWHHKDASTELRPGDWVALLLESPPKSCTPGPRRNLMAEEARCLLGFELIPR